MMTARYYAGKWNGHSIVLVNDDAEQLLIDGKEAAKNKPGIHMLIDLEGEIPFENGTVAHVHWDGGTCACIIGKPLETTYDKETKTFYAEYKGHKLEADNKKMKGKLRVDGKEIDKEEGFMNMSVILGSQPDGNGKRFMVIMSSAGAIKVNCQFYAEAENVIMYPSQKQGGELVPIAFDDGSDDFITGMMIGSMLN